MTTLMKEGYNRPVVFLLKRCLGIVLLLILSACLRSTGTPNGGDDSVDDGTDGEGSPPAPPAELPSALTFPTEIGIDVDTIRSEEDVEESGEAALGLVGTGGQYSVAISNGANTAFQFNDFMDQTLAMFSTLEIPIGSEVTTYESDMTFDMPTDYGTVEFSFFLQADFADIDYDGDGETEGCSGHTGAIPVCFRLWVDGSRVIEGVFDEYPTEETAGLGRMKMRSPMESGESDFMTNVRYDHRNPLNRQIEFLGRSRSYATNVETGEMEESVFEGHFLITQTGEEESAVKTIHMNGAVGEVGERDFSGYVGRWREDGDYWSGSTESTFEDVGVPAGFTDICAAISTGEEVARSLCLDLGIDVEGIEFVDLPTEDELQFFDFPETPTF